VCEVNIKFAYITMENIDTTHLFDNSKL